MTLVGLVGTFYLPARHFCADYHAQPRMTSLPAILDDEEMMRDHSPHQQNTQPQRLAADSHARARRATTKQHKKSPFFDIQHADYQFVHDDFSIFLLYAAPSPHFHAMSATVSEGRKSIARRGE